MLNLVWLKSFVAVIQHRSFQTAAEALELSQPAVSQHLQRLEAHLGVLLITRSRLGCEPTPPARALLPYAESLLRLEEQARRTVVQDTLRVGASSNVGIYLLLPYLQAYEAAERGHRYELLIDRNPTIAERIRRGELDVAVTEWSEPAERLRSIIWRREPLVVIVPPGHPFATQPAITKQQLANLALLGGEPGTGTGRLLAHYLGGNGRTPTVSRQLGSTEAVKQAVRAGLGISLVMASAVEEEVRAGSLCAIPLLDPGLHKEIFLTWRSRGNPAEPLPGLVEHLLDKAGPQHASAVPSVDALPSTLG